MPSNVDLCYSLLGLVLIWTLVFTFWRDYRADLLRHRLSLLRDELEAFALSGGVPASHPAYTIALELIDGAISHAGGFTGLRLLCFRVARRFAPRSPLRQWEQAWRTLPDEDARKFVANVLDQWRRTLLRHVLIGLPVAAGAAGDDVPRLRAAAGWLDLALPCAWPAPPPRSPLSSA